MSPLGPGTVIRVESEASIWMIDEARSVYMRMPKTEAGRESWFQRGPGHVLADLEWLPMTGWYMARRRSQPRLFIQVPVEGRVVSAPISEDEFAKWAHRAGE